MDDIKEAAERGWAKAAIASDMGLPRDAQMIVDALMKVVGLYMPGTKKIEMLVGRNVRATLTIEGGPLTRDVIEDTMAHLAFYKRYFPKEPDEASLTSPEQIISALAKAYADHRQELASLPQITSASETP